MKVKLLTFSILAFFVILALVAAGCVGKAAKEPAVATSKAKPPPYSTKSATETAEILKQPEAEEPKIEAKPSSTGTTDCGTDLGCFINASKSCQPTKVSHTFPINLFGMQQTTKAYYELKGSEADKCLFFIRNEKIDMKVTDDAAQQMLKSGVTKEQIRAQEEQSNQLSDKLEGRDGTCKFDTADLTDMLTRWKGGNFAFSTDPKEGDFKNAECSGTYFSSQV